MGFLKTLNNLGGKKNPVVNEVVDFPKDFIWEKDRPLSIYREDVSVEMIVDFFSSRLVGLKVVFNDELIELRKKNLDYLGIKQVLYNRLVGLLEDFHVGFDLAMSKSKILDEFKTEETIRVLH